MILANEKWAKFAFGPLLSHGGSRGANWWTTHVQQAGFRILEQGTRPLTFYMWRGDCNESNKIPRSASAVITCTAARHRWLRWNDEPPRCGAATNGPVCMPLNCWLTSLTPGARVRITGAAANMSGPPTGIFGIVLSDPKTESVNAARLAFTKMPK
jgi:hypothetical protein